MSTLLMVRHGESVANLASRYTWRDDEPLTELGHRLKLRFCRADS